MGVDRYMAHVPPTFGEGDTITSVSIIWGGKSSQAVFVSCFRGFYFTKTHILL